MIKKTLFIFTISALMACSTQKNKTAPNQTIETPKVENIKAKPVIIASGVSNFENNFTINKLSIEGDILTINISYSGGCKDHEFNLYGNEALMKSMPPKKSLFLEHLNNNDECEGWITQILKFDLTPIKEFHYQQKEITLLIDDKSVSYKL